jgi:hypothetical protein
MMAASSDLIYHFALASYAADRFALILLQVIYEPKTSSVSGFKWS